MSTASAEPPHIDVCEVMDTARALMEDPDFNSHQMVLNILVHEFINHTTPPRELSPKERELILFTVATYISMAIAIHEQHKEEEDGDQQP